MFFITADTQDLIDEVLDTLFEVEIHLEDLEEAEDRLQDLLDAIEYRAQGCPASIWDQ